HPQRVAAARVLDLDHVGPEVSEQLAAEGSREQLTDLNDPYAVQRASLEALVRLRVGRCGHDVAPGVGRDGGAGTDCCLHAIWQKSATPSTVSLRGSMDCMQSPSRFGSGVEVCATP